MIVTVIRTSTTFAVYFLKYPWTIVKIVCQTRNMLFYEILSYKVDGFKIYFLFYFIIFLKIFREKDFWKKMQRSRIPSSIFAI